VTETVPVRPADVKSGATFERFTGAGQLWFRKRVRPERDWVMRITGDPDFRTAKSGRPASCNLAITVRTGVERKLPLGLTRLARGW
jgi:hypothetical protein